MESMMFSIFNNPDIDFGEFELLEFRTIRIDDRFEDQYESWSRIYEYPIVLDMLDKYGASKDQKIHNTSWGFEGCHITFKNTLESKYSDVTNSDLKPSSEPNTIVWNITKPPPSEFRNAFDAVLNISTVEEVKFNHLVIFKNLYDQVKPGCILVITFDLPGLQIKKFEKLFDKKIATSIDNINGAISKLPNPKYKHLNCGLIVLRKD